MPHLCALHPRTPVNLVLWKSPSSETSRRIEWSLPVYPSSPSPSVIWPLMAWMISRPSLCVPLHEDGHGRSSIITVNIGAATARASSINTAVSDIPQETCRKPANDHDGAFRARYAFLISMTHSYNKETSLAAIMHGHVDVFILPSIMSSSSAHRRSFPEAGGFRVEAQGQMCIEFGHGGPKRMALDNASLDPSLWVVHAHVCVFTHSPARGIAHCKRSVPSWNDRGLSEKAFPTVCEIFVRYNIKTADTSIRYIG
ncbi:hypothetical protein LshimejAT787_0704160 [Lyophyllum shimeji]|uniref:Uncharacterized protein n=1 Tax=Lyophyllum shimeji TaxID=47721 RepID=A0A9P3PQH2_LYOSH|nr:hypothetical protein LshimejAT787_0704160 [Lyophyllum shimeji]